MFSLTRIAVLTAILLVAGTSSGLGQEGSVELLPPATGESSGEAPVETLPAPPPPCGTQPITIARMQWPTSALLAEVHSRLLAANFNCEVRVQEGDLAATGSSMGATGQPAVAPEMWVTRVAEIWNAAIKAQKVRQAGASYVEPVFEGWFLPDYVAATWPEGTTIEGIKAHIAEFSTVGGRPRFLSCPVDWGCSVINSNLLRANGLDQLFEIVEPANRFELDTLIAEAVGRREPILFYYWQPNAILAQFAFRPVDLGGYNHDAFVCMGRVACPLPAPTGFAPDPVVIALSEWVFLDAPQVAAYFARAKMPIAEMNAMLEQLGEPGGTIEAVADRFVAERGAVWRPWVGLAAEPVSADVLVEVPAATNPETVVPLGDAPTDEAPLF